MLFVVVVVVNFGDVLFVFLLRFFSLGFRSFFPMLFVVVVVIVFVVVFVL